MNDLIKKRALIKRKLTLFQKFINLISDDNLGQLRVRHPNEVKLLLEFQEIQDKIELDTEENKLDEEFEYREVFETQYYEIMAKVEGLLYKPINNQEPSVKNETISVLNNIKLPHMPLPQFDGNYSSWIEYKEIFLSMIHNNESLNNIQKYYYLRASLEGNASQVIRAVEFTPECYDAAWELLCDRYDNNQLLIKNHLKGIFDLPIVTKPTSKIYRKFVDDIAKHLKSLNALNLPTEHWDIIIIYIVTEKLDKDTLKGWEESNKKGVLPTLIEFKQYLKARSDLLETLEERTSTSVKFNKNVTVKQVSLLTSRIQCYNCEGGHSIYKCDKFMKKSIAERQEQVAKLKLCKNCLRPGHIAKDCPAGNCKKCNGKHNSLLHNENTLNRATTTTAMLANEKHMQGLLATALVKVEYPRNKATMFRAILDSGSQTNFICQATVDQLGLKTRDASLSVIGINQISSVIKKKCTLTIKSTYNSYTKDVTCYVLPKVSDDMPSMSFSSSALNIPSNIQLADPTFFDSNKVDLLLGAAIFWEIIRSGKVTLGRNLPVLHNTALGWIVAGPLAVPHQASSYCNLVSNRELHNQLQKFWQTEEVNESIMSANDQDCELQFQETTERTTEGRFVVEIPFKKDPSKLGNSREISLKRFYALERKLNQNKALKDQYIQFMDEYIALGHMTKCAIVDDTTEHFYLPHHCVTKQDNITTKLRVVFDGSAASDSGWSLNDIQHIGPPLQQDIFSILIRFREHKIVITADIQKMYRQIYVKKEFQKYQRVWWRRSSNDPIEVYELNTVTYGLTSSPYLAIRCIRQLAAENASKHPQASNIINRDMYVDDLISGANTIDEAQLLCQEITKVLQKGQFELRKWSSNEPEVLNSIDKTQHLSYLQDFGDNSHKMLGLQWSASQDTLRYSISTTPLDRITKRSILSEIAKIYDPLGLIVPFVIIPKILLQQLWLHQSDWDEEVPNDIEMKWKNIHGDCEYLNRLSIPRHTFLQEDIELHGFCDASMYAYAACVYVKSTSIDGQVQVKLLCAKAKVAPLKSISIPRLELCGALLLTKLMESVNQSLVKRAPCTYWSDSQIVLCWLRFESTRLQTFVSNRVSEIQSKTDIDAWYHVGSKENPADIASRGITAEQLINHEMWWTGPSFLYKSRELWPTNDSTLSFQELPEIKQSKVQALLSNTSSENTSFLFLKFSNWTKLKRVTAWCYRFISNCSVKRESRMHGPLTVSELNYAIKKLISKAQSESYLQEIEQLKLNKLSKSSKLRSLCPFLDQEGIMRVGGRLHYSCLPYDQKHQILLAAKHPLSYLLLSYEHIKLYHAGPLSMIASLRNKFWIINARNLAKGIVRQCIRCYKVKPRTKFPMMGDLPSCRVTESFPFQVTGSDYCGPFLIRERRGRRVNHLKIYICLFICMTTKALHLEMVTDLTKECFLKALQRFTSRRGIPSTIMSDNGTTYVGANNELKQFFAKYNTEFQETLANDGINWKFIPPHAPNFGGIWESNVKQVKYHLKRVLIDTNLTMEDFLTVLIKIEGILNSRPLCPLSSDPHDLNILTPAHFLLGRTMNHLPENDQLSSKGNYKANYHQMQALQQQFWKRWSSTYLNELQPRTKWTTHETILKKGSLVIIKEDHQPPYQWKMGRIVDTHPGHDDIIRVATVHTTTGTYKRPVNKLCVLPIDI